MIQEYVQKIDFTICYTWPRLRTSHGECSGPLTAAEETGGLACSAQQWNDSSHGNIQLKASIQYPRSARHKSFCTPETICQVLQTGYTFNLLPTVSKLDTRKHYITHQARSGMLRSPRLFQISTILKS